MLSVLRMRQSPVGADLLARWRTQHMYDGRSRWGAAVYSAVRSSVFFAIDQRTESRMIRSTPAHRQPSLIRLSRTSNSGGECRRRNMTWLKIVGEQTNERIGLS